MVVALAPGLREVIVPPYRILYRAESPIVEIVLVVHGARYLPHLLHQLSLFEDIDPAPGA